MLEECRWNSDGGTLRWNSGTVLVKECGVTVEQWTSDVKTVWWNSGTVLVEQWNSDGGTV